jgi:chromosome segregation ATPase
MAKNDVKLPAGSEPEALKSGEDAALEALAESAQSMGDDEVDASDKVAETLTTLQNLVERHALELEEIKGKLRDHRTSLKDVYENDPALSEAQAELETHSVKVKDRKAQLQSNPEAMTLKTKIGELREQQRELEETLSNHLVNYHTLTNSNSFDTSDGDQWEFSITAKIKPRKKHKED